jgi:tetratricopeptide (TPR) repeat protein
MGYLGPQSVFPNPMVPDREISPFALSLCALAERRFVKACDYLIGGNEERARRKFMSAARENRNFLDAWFMVGFLELVNCRPEQARQAFLHILQSKTAFEGLYMLRFLPTLRVHVNLFEDFQFRIMPTTADVAAALARLYIIEGRPREAKKIIAPAFKKYWDNPSVQAVWAQSMLDSDSADEVIKELDYNNEFQRGTSELDLLVIHLIGRAYMDKGDFRSAISHWEGLLHAAKGKNPRLMDRFRIITADAYEQKGFLLDALDVLQSVEDGTMCYKDDVPVSLKREDIADRIKTFNQEGIVKCLQFHDQHEYPRWRPAEGFLEFQNPGHAPA